MPMPTYISLMRWTEQGIKSAGETVNRAEQARAAVERMGGQLRDVYWTQGAYDIVAVADWPDEEAATAFLLATGMQGNLRSETLRAFSAEEMRRILQKLPQP
jgi:uncharacterized protein with GYD domain